MLQTMDLFIFTLGLTEAWVHRDTGTVYPTAPGTIAGRFDENIYEFQKNLLKLRPDGKLPKILLTVSPVPLVATASGNHVLTATNY